MEIRPATAEELPAFRKVAKETVGEDAGSDPEATARLRSLLETGQAWVAVDRGRVVATAATLGLTLAVPGGVLPMSGLAMVAVRPTHRRRGILRQLVGAHLDEASRRGDPVSGLWSTETSIYGRFGYGIAAEADDLTFTTTGLEIGAGLPGDELDLVDDPEDVLPAIYERALRPGCCARSPTWWQRRIFAEGPAFGASNRRFVVSSRDGTPTGYVTYRQLKAWEQGLPAGTVWIMELIAVDARAEATLWRYVASIDLFPKVWWRNAPVDSTLPWLVSAPGRLIRRRYDGLWLRIADLVRTLEARTYGTDGVLRLAVDGGPTVELRIESGRARGAAVDGSPELSFTRSAIGSVYLGGVRPSLLSGAGLVTGSARTLALADRLFSAPQAPWCAERF